MGAPKLKIRTFRDLRIYQAAMGLAIEIFELTKNFPKEETYSLADQMRRSTGNKKPSKNSMKDTNTFCRSLLE